MPVDTKVEPVLDNGPVRMAGIPASLQLVLGPKAKGVGWAARQFPLDNEAAVIDIDTNQLFFFSGTSAIAPANLSKAAFMSRWRFSSQSCIGRKASRRKR